MFTAMVGLDLSLLLLREGRTAELKAINARLSQSNEELDIARRTALDMS